MTKGNAMKSWTRPLFAASTLLAVLFGALPALAAQESATSYQSPTYGYGIRWDTDVWSMDEEAVLVADGPAVVDQVRLVKSSGGALHVVGAALGYADAVSCIDAEADLLGAAAGVSSVVPLVQNDGQALAGEVDGIAYAGFQLTYTPETGAALDLMHFIECRLLPGSNASLVFALATTPDQFERDMAAAGAVNETLAFPLAQTATPAAGLDSEATANQVDDAWFTDQVAAATAAASVAGPLDGELVQATGRSTLFVPGVNNEHFYLRVRFQNPSDAIDAPWDFGVTFREDPAGEHYRLVFDSFGGWYLTVGIDEDVQTGSVASLQSGAGGVNSLELVVAGETGAFRLNGELVGPLDLAAIPGAGQIAIGTAFFAANTVEGAITSYRDLQIWPLAAPPTPPASIPTPTPRADDPAAATPEPAVEADTPPTLAAPTVEPAAEPTPTFVAATEQQVVVRLAPVNDSGVEGLAVIYPDGEQTTIALRILGASVDEVGAIHTGTCSSIEPLPDYALAIFDPTGSSSSTINIQPSELQSGQFVVVLHESTAAFGTIVACGAIPAP